MDWLLNYWETLTWTGIFFGLGIFLLSLTVSFAAIVIVMVKIPENYFSSHYEQDFLPNS